VHYVSPIKTSKTTNHIETGTAMSTQVFKSLKEFKRRQDKNVNGVDAAFASRFPEYASMNDSNTGCWNCVECRGCDNCYNCCNCRGCSYCKDSVDCSDCVNCQSCENCRDCSGCIQCNSCVDCENCNACTECANLEGHSQIVASSI